MVIAAGIGIGVKSIHEIVTSHHAPAPFTLIVLIVVIIVKEVLFRRVLSIAKEENSGAVTVDAWHHRADAITSAAAFIGISVALFGQRIFDPAAVATNATSRWASADDYAALLAAGIICYNGWLLLRIPLHDLMDADPTGADQWIVETARAIAFATDGVRGIEKVRARRSGSRSFLEMHVEVDPDMPVLEAHVVGGRVRSTIREKLPRVADVLIHIEPHRAHPTLPRPIESALPSHDP